MERSVRLIGLYGYPGCGKDTVASHMPGWTRVAFADPLREMLVALDPIIEVYSDYSLSTLSQEMSRWDLDLEGVKRSCPEVRRLLQRLGTEAGRKVLGENVWVNAAKSRIERVWMDGGRVALTDCRFPNEYQMVRSMGGLMVQIKRPNCNGSDHESEQHYGEFLADFTIYNNGSLEQLRKAAEDLVEVAAGRKTVMDCMVENKQLSIA